MGGSPLQGAVPRLRGQRWALSRKARPTHFADFVEAFGFMTKVALVAEVMDHHPQWSNVWNRVSIDLITHYTACLSTLDVEMARRIDESVI